MICDKVLSEEAMKMTLDPEGVLRIEGCIYVSRVGDLVRLILEKSYNSRYSMYPGTARL